MVMLINGLATESLTIQIMLAGVTGIQGKRERKAGTGTCKNRCYLSDSLLVKFSKLCKPSHKYSIVVEFFLSHNKRQPAQNSISTDAIRDLL